MLAKGFGVICMKRSPLYFFLITLRQGNCGSVVPKLFISLYPIEHLPSTCAYDKEGKDMFLVLRRFVSQNIRPTSLKPVVIKGFIVFIRHESIDAHIEEKSIGPVRQRLVRR